VRIVEAQCSDVVERRTGVRLVVTRVAVRNLSAPRDVELADGVLTRDCPQPSSAMPMIDLVVEAIGGIEPARELILEALANGKPVITANKELLANVGAELYAAADAAGCDLLFEAAVAGGIPIVRALRESLHGEPISRVLGIINGTTNFILTKMTDAVAAGGERPTTRPRWPKPSVWDSPSATPLPTSRASMRAPKRRSSPPSHSVRRWSRVTSTTKGISRITGAEIAIAHRLGYVVKLLGIVERDADSGETSACGCIPAMVPVNHPLASVRDSFNAVFVEGDFVDSLMFYGRGAGGAPTASAVFGDVVDAAVNLRKRHARVARHARTSDGSCHRRDIGGVPARPRRRRQARCAPRGHGCLRVPRREHPRRRAGGQRTRCPARVHHPSGARVRRAGNRA
jgi:homoserine dehydrogenase